MKKQFFGVFIACLLYVPCHAGNIDTFGIGAKATALGGAVAAQADDPFALYYNPAGMSWVPDRKFSMGVQVLIPDLKIENFKVKSSVQEALGEPQDPLIKDPKSFSNDSNALFIPCLGYTMPINDKIHAGFAVYVPWGIELEWDSNPVNNPAAFNAYHSYLIREVFSPGISYRVNDKLSIGMALSLGKSHDGMEKLLYISSDMGHVARQGEGLTRDLLKAVNNMVKGDAPGPDLVTTASEAAAALNASWDSLNDQNRYLAELFTEFSNAGLETPKQIGQSFADTYDGVPGRDHGAKVEVEMFDHFNISYNFGLLYQHSDSIRLGLTYRSQTKEDYQGDMEVIYPDGTVWTTDAHMTYKHPDQIQGGIRYQPHDTFVIEMDMVWTQWSVMERQVLTLNEPLMVHILPGNRFIDSSKVTFDHPRHWIDTIQKRFGMEWNAKKWLTFRLGYFYDPSPVPDETMDFQWPDADKKIYSLGLGLNGSALYLNNRSLGLDKLNIDLTFQYGKSEYKRYLGGESINLNHDYDLTHKEGQQNYYDRHVETSASGTIWGFGFNVNYQF
ncbi:MAG: long-chain fatty acid transport protein [Candidatus Magnetoglobus multicellularis str. Araruama]|uniref:Long-chain fatty acid transport protein n=1 Tax=Candidatus Magnetoglobus multicellularis str. Araruama TaxID=890399 RepID=A0A1V1P5X7_9BACT|nr:MAG: long-chain fatty acid transport protein [Candidatus Magnetoglobus multicellularis str. Araruama]